MKVIVKTPFFGAVDGTVHPRRFVQGDTVEGDLARVAVQEGWAEEEKAAPAPKAKAGGKAAAAKPASDDLLG